MLNIKAKIAVLITLAATSCEKDGYRDVHSYDYEMAQKACESVNSNVRTLHITPRQSILTDLVTCQNGERMRFREIKDK